MKIILKSDIEKVGVAGDVVNVADGFARNYLIPKGYALFASPGNLKKVENIREIAQEERVKRENELKEMAKQIKGIEIHFERMSDKNGHLFGSVSELDIVQELEARNITIHKSNVNMSAHLKEVGSYYVTIKYSQDIQANLKVVVESENAPEPEPAEAVAEKLDYEAQSVDKVVVAEEVQENIETKPQTETEPVEVASVEETVEETPLAEEKPAE
ncbi:MAG: 50S ribosomal protein L9 [Candidatus Cloacimonetes bacterium]|nr:50S ribosomal protein L9 [Candidatus Cloacimonadota bacterium]